jgi:hypothetical protein
MPPTPAFTEEAQQVVYPANLLFVVVYPAINQWFVVKALFNLYKIFQNLHTAIYFLSFPRLSTGQKQKSSPKNAGVLFFDLLLEKSGIETDKRYR